MAGLTLPVNARSLPSRAVRDSLIVTIGGQVERFLGIAAALAIRWGLDPSQLGVYTGLRLYLDNTNRSSLGISLGAVQEIPILRSAGRFDDANRVTNVAHTTNTITCVCFALGLLVWAGIRSSRLTDSALSSQWTWGLVMIAGLAILKRYQDFQIAVLRSHQEFSLTTRLAVLDGLLAGLLMPAGVWFAGLWGLLGSVGILLAFNIAYLQRVHPLRLQYDWDRTIAWRLMRVGLPILANTTSFGLLQTVDRWIILGRLNEGEHAAGLYSLAILGTSWSLDLAGRIVTVMYTYFQATLGRTGDPAQVANQAMRVTEAQAPWLGLAGAWAYLIGPESLARLIPRYAEGVTALRPLLPGMILLGLAWPARQMLITVGRPFRLCAVTCLGLVATTIAATIGADHAGIVGVAWGMTFGYALVYGLTAYVAFGRGWPGHFRTVLMGLAVILAGPLAAHGPWGHPAARVLILVIATIPWMISLKNSTLLASQHEE